MINQVTFFTTNLNLPILRNSTLLRPSLFPLIWFTAFDQIMFPCLEAGHPLSANLEHIPNDPSHLKGEFSFQIHRIPWPS